MGILATLDPVTFGGFENRTFFFIRTAWVNRLPTQTCLVVVVVELTPLVVVVRVVLSVRYTGSQPSPTKDKLTILGVDIMYK